MAVGGHGVQDGNPEEDAGAQLRQAAPGGARLVVNQRKATVAPCQLHAFVRLRRESRYGPEYPPRPGASVLDPVETRP